MKVAYKFEGTKLMVSVDGNEDGEAVLTVTIDLAEIPDEVMGLIAAKKSS